jgi:hypothetical protein
MRGGTASGHEVAYFAGTGEGEEARASEAFWGSEVEGARGYALFEISMCQRRHYREAIMNEDVFNMSVRKFLKKVGVTSQREIEEAVRLAVGSGRLKGNEVLPAKVKLMVGGIDLSVEIEGTVELE